MAIPDYQTCMLPLLKSLCDGQEHTLRSVVDRLAEDFGLTQNELAQLLPSGQGPMFKNRVGWARTYLKKAGLIDSPKRGVFRINERGKLVLQENPQRIDVKYLERFPEFLEFINGAKQHPVPKFIDFGVSDPSPSFQTPEETLETAYQNIRESLAEELLQKILSCSPSFFEYLVIELLVKMGYGGSRKDAGERVGQSGDGGIDGIIKEDRLGLDTIYLQAKRWQGNVGRPEIQKFVGALSGQRAKKGVFITTSGFTADAKEYASLIETKVVLIDGEMLANLMMDYDVGVATHASYVIKRIDSDYFEEA